MRELKIHKKIEYIQVVLRPYEIIIIRAIELLKVSCH